MLVNVRTFFRGGDIKESFANILMFPSTTVYCTSAINSIFLLAYFYMENIASKILRRVYFIHFFSCGILACEEESECAACGPIGTSRS